MVREVEEKVFAETLANGDTEKAFVFNLFNGAVTLLSDLESIYDEVDTNLETMRFEILENLHRLSVEDAAVKVRDYYSGGITIEPYENENDAIRAFMTAYEGLYCRHYLISNDVTIDEIRRLNDGILFIYIEGDADE